METENSVPSSDSLVNNTNDTNGICTVVDAHGIVDDEATEDGAGAASTSLSIPQTIKSQSDDGDTQLSATKPLNGFIDKTNSCDIERKLNETQDSLKSINSRESNIGYVDDDNDVEASGGDESLGACYSPSSVAAKGALETNEKENDINGECVFCFTSTEHFKVQSKSNILIRNTKKKKEAKMKKKIITNCITSFYIKPV